MSTRVLKISQTPLSKEEKDLDFLTDPVIQTHLTSYDPNESWMVTNQRSAKIATQIAVVKPEVIFLDLPETHINLSKYIKHMLKGKRIELFEDAQACMRIVNQWNELQQA